MLILSAFDSGEVSFFYRNFSIISVHTCVISEIRMAIGD
jgi:hypothetical protein